MVRLKLVSSQICAAFACFLSISKWSVAEPFSQECEKAKQGVVNWRRLRYSWSRSVQYQSWPTNERVRPESGALLRQWPVEQPKGVTVRPLWASMQCHFVIWHTTGKGCRANGQSGLKRNRHYAARYFASFFIHSSRVWSYPFLPICFKAKRRIWSLIWLR